MEKGGEVKGNGGREVGKKGKESLKNVRDSILAITPTSAACFAKAGGAPFPPMRGNRSITTGISPPPPIYSTQ